MARLIDRRRAALSWTRVALAAGVVIVVLGGAGLSWRQSQERTELAKALTGGNPEHAPALMTRYGCAGCHTIAGMPGADGKVAPPLRGLLQRVFIGGNARNTPENLVAWIVNPQRFDPHTAMPPTGIGEGEARDVAAYLYEH